MVVLLRFCIFTVLASTILSAQEPEPLSFFPHHVGDTWAYQYEGGTILNSIITDIEQNEQQSILIYLNNNTEPAYKITSDLDVYFSPTHNPHLDYKLTAQAGDTWRVTAYSNSSLVARVQQRYQTLVFGQPTILMAINYYEVVGSDTIITENSPYRYTHFLASGFGFIRQLGESGDVPIDLLGCIINGKTFGNVTDVQQISVPTFTVEVFPNPCSGFATLRYSIPPGATGAHLSITDIFGNSVHTADINNDSYTLDISRLLNGIYFCTLCAGFYTTTVPIVIQI